MYSNIVTIGKFVWVPSSGVLGGNDIDPGTSNVNIDGADLEEEKKDVWNWCSLLLIWDQLLESMSTRSDSTSLNMDRQSCSIPKVMVELHSIPRVAIDDDFHDFVTKYLNLRMKKEMWSSMGGLERS
ncbi:hypothetical protein Peur_025413 [Populus x canadensis]